VLFYAFLFTYSLWMYTMNRCLVSTCTFLRTLASLANPTASLRWLTVVMAFAMPLAAQAQSSNATPAQEQPPAAGEFVGRQFPPNVLRGTLEVLQGSEILLDYKPARLSPGGRIRGINNTLVLPGSLIGMQYTVNFTRDLYGNVHQVWLLTELEAAQKIKTATPERNFSFGYEDTGKVDDGKTPFNQLPKYKQ
jgi:hypothetical protein